MTVIVVAMMTIVVVVVFVSLYVRLSCVYLSCLSVCVCLSICLSHANIMLCGSRLAAEAFAVKAPDVSV